MKSVVMKQEGKAAPSKKKKKSFKKSAYVEDGCYLAVPRAMTLCETVLYGDRNAHLCPGGASTGRSWPLLNHCFKYSK